VLYINVVQLLLTYGPFYKNVTARGLLPIKWCSLWNRFRTVKTKNREDRWMSHWNSNLLQISISGMPVAKASLTLSYSVSLPIRFLILDLIASTQKMHSHTFCWLTSRSSLQSLTPSLLLKDVMLVLTKITYCRDEQLIWLTDHFEMAAFSR